MWNQTKNVSKDSKNFRNLERKNRAEEHDGSSWTMKFTYIWLWCLTQLRHHPQCHITQCQSQSATKWWQSEVHINYYLCNFATSMLTFINLHCLQGNQVGLGIWKKLKNKFLLVQISALMHTHGTLWFLFSWVVGVTVTCGVILCTHCSKIFICSC